MTRAPPPPPGGAQRLGFQANSGYPTPPLTTTGLKPADTQPMHDVFRHGAKSASDVTISPLVDKGDVGHAIVLHTPGRWPLPKGAKLVWVARSGTRSYRDRENSHTYYIHSRIYWIEIYTQVLLTPRFQFVLPHKGLNVAPQGRRMLAELVNIYRPRCYPRLSRFPSLHPFPISSLKFGTSFIHFPSRTLHPVPYQKHTHVPIL